MQQYRQQMGDSDIIDSETLARELVRALRGKRSQTAASRRLGYTTNVLYGWESGRRFPTLSELIALLGLGKRDFGEALAAFLGVTPNWYEGAAPDQLAARLLETVRGDTPVVDLARRSGLSRYAVARFLRGQAQPRLPALLALLEGASGRALDFVATLVDPNQLPSFADAWRAVEARRNLATDDPWTLAIQYLLETDAYRCSPAHRPGFLAARLGIDPEQEARALTRLEQARVIRWDGTHYRVGAAVTVDTTSLAPEARAALRAHWARAGAAAIEAGRPGVYSWNVFTVSSEDLARLEELQRAYFRSLRALVAASEPAQHVVVANAHLFALDPPTTTASTT